MKHLLKALVAFSFLFVVACSDSDQNSEGQNIISEDFQEDNMEFPGGVPVFVALIKLKQPALLEALRVDENGEKAVDADLRQRVEEEQIEMIEKISRISSDIKILYTYKLVLNALAVEAPQSLAGEINELDVDFIEPDERFSLPKVLVQNENQEKSQPDLNKNNSMTFIGVDKIQETLKIANASGDLVPVRGQGIKVGIIDSGIDYTHKMLGGSGDVTVYEEIDANQASDLFPNSKVVGGKDFVGENYAPGAHIYQHRIPKPDDNPLDRGGHGTHVAGTVAGVGDGVNTYDGAAPDAELYALKVFSDNGGGTSDTVVIAALEYAADPNGDLEINDKLDVVNLSLGGGYGKPHNLYGQAIRNLVEGGVVTVASAGNSGPVANIVGAPSTAAEAISVAASIDNMDHNYRFDAVKFSTLENPELLAEVVQGDVTVPLSELEDVIGSLVHIGIAEELTEEQKASVKDKVALIDRGEVSFAQKIQNALDAGALGVIMVNNQEGDPIRMGGGNGLEIPAVMISLQLGNALKSSLEKGEKVEVQFKPEKQIVKEELIDTLTGFSSQGPRDLDALIKPEITAPGLAIISAEAGSGDQGVKFGGTSMSAPHVAGVAALLVQYRNELEAKDIKSLIMNTAELISDEEGEMYPISRQGAGRIRAYEAATTDIIFSKPSVSLGKISVRDITLRQDSIILKNLKNTPVEYNFEIIRIEGMELKVSPEKMTLRPGSSKKIDITAKLTSEDNDVVEANAFVKIKSNEKTVGYIPVLGVLSRTTSLYLEGLSYSGENLTAHLLNNGRHDGEALLFNLLGQDKRKIADPQDLTLSRDCDLESAGYRVIERDEKKYFQVAAKLYKPVSGWESCDVYVEFDFNADQIADKEMYGSTPGNYPGFSDVPALRDLGLSGMLFNSEALRLILEQHALERAKQLPEAPELDYTPALENVFEMKAYRQSTISVLEVPVENLASNSKLDVKVTVSYNGRHSVERDDELSDLNGVWKSVDLGSGASFVNLPETVSVQQGEKVQVVLNKGEGDEKLVAYFPRNEFFFVEEGQDFQSSIVDSPLQAPLRP